jgi:hypothetical protein
MSINKHIDEYMARRTMAKGLDPTSMIRGTSANGHRWTISPSTVSEVNEHYTLRPYKVAHVTLGLKVLDDDEDACLALTQLRKVRSYTDGLVKPTSLLELTKYLSLPDNLCTGVDIDVTTTDSYLVKYTCKDTVLLTLALSEQFLHVPPESEGVIYKYTNPHVLHAIALA